MAASTLMAASMASTGIGGLISAGSTLAGGNAAAQAGGLEAAQLRQNASQAMASGQRQMLDTQMRTRQAISTATARAGASGVAPDSGSPLADVRALGQRGSYQALMDMFNGESEATGLRNQANAAEWTGQVKQQESRAAALGTLAGTAGSMFQQYGMMNYPRLYGYGRFGGRL